MLTFSTGLMEEMYGDAAVLRYLEITQKEYINGNRTSILSALLICAKYQTVIPEWVSDELLTIEDKINSGAVKDLNDFFGVKFEHKAKSTKEYKIKKAFDKVFSALFQHRLSSGNFTTGDGLSEVAEKTGEPRRIVEEIYNKEKENLKKLPTKIEKNTNYCFARATILDSLGRRYGRKILKD